MPMISSIAECAAAAAKHDIPVIADGGIRTSGDAAKARLRTNTEEVVARGGYGSPTIFVGDDMFEAHPDCPLCYAEYRVKAAPATGFVEDGDVLDLGNRTLQVLHTPGHQAQPTRGEANLWKRVEPLIAEVGAAPLAVLEAANGPAVKARLKDHVEQATARGVFGSPSFITADGELFWGNDRLESALDWAVHHRSMESA